MAKKLMRVSVKLRRHTSKLQCAKKTFHNHFLTGALITVKIRFYLYEYLANSQIFSNSKPIEASFFDFAFNSSPKISDPSGGEGKNSLNLLMDSHIVTKENWWEMSELMDLA